MKTLIINGGDPLDGCPKDWDEAKTIISKLNHGKEEDEPEWDWDCGFKLDYDGGILTLESRFYPPKTHYGMTWDGTVTFSLIGEVIMEKKFDCKTLDELVQKVEKFVTHYISCIKSRLKS